MSIGLRGVIAVEVDREELEVRRGLLRHGVVEVGPVVDLTQATYGRMHGEGLVRWGCGRPAICEATCVHEEGSMLTLAVPDGSTTPSAQ
eukprot:4956647-Pleurochrysis_carterae.AAC.2